MMPMAHPVTAPGTFTRAQRAKRELARRELARRHLIDFASYVDPDAAIEGATDTFVQNRYRPPHRKFIASYV